MDASEFEVLTADSLDELAVAALALTPAGLSPGCAVEDAPADLRID
jgi:hypothetical protein